MFQRRMAKKSSDPGMVSISCVIGETKIDRAMLDLGASINVLPYSLYKLLGLGPLHETGIVTTQRKPNKLLRNIEQVRVESQESREILSMVIY